jgi:PQQ-dependent catabolism-associated CXXCW motif protein
MRPTAVVAMWLVAFAGNACTRPRSPERGSFTTAQAEELWKTGAIFVDVLPYVRRPANLPPGTIWREPERMNIPGSVWLPDTGYGALSPTSEGYLRGSLDHVTDGDKHKCLVIYCR